MASLQNMLVFQDPWPIEALGLLAGLASLFVYLSDKMIPLRIAAIVANALFAAYFFIKGYHPQLFLNVVLLPLNMYKLWKIRQILDAVKAASKSDFNFDWLKPYMTPQKVRAGQTLYRAGDVAKDAHILVSGRLFIPEHGIELLPGTLFGEMALFSEDNRRTASIEARTDADLLRMRYEDFISLTAEDSVFAFYVMRLLARRAQHNLELARAAVHSTG